MVLWSINDNCLSETDMFFGDFKAALIKKHFVKEQYFK